LGPRPPFEYRVLKENGRHRVWTDSLGITQMGLVDDWRNGWSGFTTRTWIDFPVKNREDFLKMRRRYDPLDPKRYPENWRKLVEKYRNRDYPLCVSVRGPFWWTRDMVGLKGIALGIYRNPDLIREIVDFCEEFQTQALHRALDDLDVDFAIMSEDMAYKSGPIVGPEAVEELMGEAYRDIAEFLREHGVKILIVDSDGNVNS
jgi:uroporphyrinogen decarboxylase